LQNPYEKMNNVCLLILAAVAITTALIYTRVVLVPFMFALFFYTVAAPAVRWFQSKLKLPRIAAVALTLALFFSVVVVLFLFISSSLEDFQQSAGDFGKKIGEFVQRGIVIARNKGLKIDEVTIISAIKEMFAPALNLTGYVLSLLGNSILVLVFFFFLMAGEGMVTKRNRLVAEIQNKISRYISTKFTTSLITGTLIGSILAIMGVELAFMFGVLTFLLNFIPNIGSLIATALPLPVVLLQYGFGWEFLTVLMLCGVIQFSIGNVIEPKLMGESMDLHPVTILMFLIFWGLVWGLPGMFLAVPITAILKIILQRITTTRKIAELFAGRLPT